MSEKETQREILDWLADHGFWRWRCPLGGLKLSAGRGKAPSPMAGHPDIAGILPGSGGRYFAIEVKTKGGRFRPKQIEWAARASTEKVFYLVAYSIADVIREFGPYIPKLTPGEMADAIDSAGDW